MKELILNNNFDDIDYIIENDTLYFDDKSIASLSGANERTVRRNCKEVLEEYEAYIDFRTNMTKSLYIDKSTGGRPRRYYSHYIAGDVLHRLKSPRAIEFRIWANEKTFRKPEPVNNYINVFEWECEVEDLQGRRKVDSNFLSWARKRAQVLEQNGEMEELKRIQAVISDASDEFNQISLDISNATEVISCFEKIRELSPKVTNSKYWGQNHLIPFKKS